jgi:hypothetical protein
MNREANVKLFMLRPESLLLQARLALQIDVRDESVEDVERVDRSLANTQTTRSGTRAPDVIDIICDAWEDILQSVKGRRRVAWMLLSNATAVTFSGADRDAPGRRELPGGVERSTARDRDHWADGSSVTDEPPF